MSDFFNPASLIETVGLFGIVAIIFAESGLFFGFFFPGDSLLFTAGVFAAAGYLPVVPLVILSFIAAVLGDAVGYWFGRKFGENFFKREDSLFFKKSYLDKTTAFYAKHGRKTIVLARFIPIVRTFAPILAGVGGMRYRDFLSYNIIGALIWVAGFTLPGYFLGQFIPNVEKYLFWFVGVIIIFSFYPLLLQYARRGSGKTVRPS
jgi:membrane-associated protein